MNREQQLESLLQEYIECHESKGSHDEKSLQMYDIYMKAKTLLEE